MNRLEARHWVLLLGVHARHGLKVTNCMGLAVEIRGRGLVGAIPIIIYTKAEEFTRGAICSATKDRERERERERELNIKATNQRHKFPDQMWGTEFSF
jgi:hypothetical protein